MDQTTLIAERDAYKHDYLVEQRKRLFLQWQLIQIKANSEDEKKKAKEALDALGDPKLERVRGDKLTFVSMPYSHADESVVEARMDAFARVMASLTQSGETPVSPLSFHYILPVAPELGKDWKAWERYSKVLLSRCDRLLIIRIEGWEKSEGVAGEIAEAKSLGIPVEYA